MPIYGEWHNPGIRRCYGKVRFKRIETATDVAARMSLKTGEVLIAHQCPDCLRFHVGHADPTQLLIRDLPSICCFRCKGPITLAQKLKGMARDGIHAYCSEKCEQEDRVRIERRRRRKQAQKDRKRRRKLERKPADGSG